MPELVALAYHNGFDDWLIAAAMGAIAMRESRGNPQAFNGNTKTGDRSYGCCQINMASPEVAQLIKSRIPRVAAFETALYDPDINFQAAFLLWDRHNRNLDTAWYIKGGVVNGVDRTRYRLDYESHLPAAVDAALTLWRPE